MNSTNLQRQWQHAATRFGLQVETPFTVHLPDGKSFEVEVLVRGYGAPAGTIVVSDFNSIAAAKNEIKQAGFTISRYSQPSEEQVTSVDGFPEMLAEWGIAAPETREA